MNRDVRSDFLSSVTLVDIVQAAWSKRWSGAFLFMLLSGLFVAAIVALPNRYVSNAQLLVRLGRGAVSMDPTTSLGQTVSLQESRITQVNSVVELMSSREMHERVVNRVGAERILEPIGIVAVAMDKSISFVKSLLPKSETKPEGGLSADEIDELKVVAEACRAIYDGYAVESPKDSYTIGVEYVSNSPFLSRDVVAAFVEEYPDYHIQAHQSGGSLPFFEQESRTAFAVATAAQEAVRKLKAEHGIIDLDLSKSALRGELTQVEREINQITADLASVDAELRQLEVVMTAMPDQIESETVTGIFKRSGDLIRDRFFDLELEAKELSTKLKPDHPKLVAINAQLAASKAIADKEIGQEPQVRQVVNPNLQKMDLESRTAIARKAGLEAKHIALEAQHERVREDLMKLNAVGAELTKLTWDADVAESMYRRTADRLANAKQIAALEHHQLSDVSIAQGATLEMKKVGPNRPVLAILGLAVAAALSFFQSALRGLVKQSRAMRTTSIDAATRSIESQGEQARVDPSSAPQPAFTEAASASAQEQREGRPFVGVDVVMDKPVPR